MKILTNLINLIISSRMIMLSRRWKIRKVRISKLSKIWLRHLEKIYQNLKGANIGEIIKVSYYFPRPVSLKDIRDVHEEISKDEIVISLIFSWNVFNQNCVNCVNMLV